jgi:hypothetical protein
MDRDLTWRKLVEAGLATIASGAAFSWDQSGSDFSDRARPGSRKRGYPGGAGDGHREVSRDRGQAGATDFPGGDQPPGCAAGRDARRRRPAGDRHCRGPARRDADPLLLTGVSSVADVTGQGSSRIGPSRTFLRCSEPVPLGAVIALRRLRTPEGIRRRPGAYRTRNRVSRSPVS